MKKYCILSVCISLVLVSCKIQHNKGRVSFLVGKVILDGKPAKVGQMVRPGAVISTKGNSLCEVIFDDKNIVRVNPGSSVVMHISKTVRRIEIQSGGVASVLKKLTKDGFAIQTPTTAASIRGTSFFIKVEDPQNTYLCDCNGIITVQDINKKTKRKISASHHKAVRITRKGDTIVINDAGMKYHRDANIEKLAQKIGVTIDWNSVDEM